MLNVILDSGVTLRLGDSVKLLKNSYYPDGTIESIHITEPKYTKRRSHIMVNVHKFNFTIKLWIDDYNKTWSK